MRNETVDEEPNRAFIGFVVDTFSDRLLREYQVIQPETVNGISFLGGDEIYQDVVTGTWHYMREPYKIKHIRKVETAPGAPKYNDPLEEERTLAEVFNRVRMQEEMQRHLADSVDSLMDSHRVTSKGIIEALGILAAIQEAIQPKGAEK